MTVDAMDRCDAVERELLNRAKEIYSAALVRALKTQKAFFRKIRDIDSGRIKPPKYYVDRGEVGKWREGFVRELMRQANLIARIMQELDAAGGKAAKLIQETLPQYYQIVRDDSIERIGVNQSFAMLNREQIQVLIQQNESPYSRIAYRTLGSNAAVRRRLQNEMAQATILGESQDQIIRRIRGVTGQSWSNARRVAQTERTRVQSQARNQTSQEAQKMGINVAQRWSTRMVNSRDTHIALNGKWALPGEAFPGSVLRFPGDPRAPAREVINCHCVLVPDVLPDGKTVRNGVIVDE